MARKGGDCLDLRKESEFLKLLETWVIFYLSPRTDFNVLLSASYQIFTV